MRRMAVVMTVLVALALYAAGCANCPLCRVFSGKSSRTEAGASSATVAAETKCPVLGEKVDPNVYADHQGKRIYFCCPACVDAFLKNPAKYAANLPAGSTVTP